MRDYYCEIDNSVLNSSIKSYVLVFFVTSVSDGMGGGSTFYMVDPERELTVAFLSAGFIEGVPHLFRVARLNDLVLAACE